MMSKTAITNAVSLFKKQQCVLVRSAVAASTSSDKYVPRKQPDSQQMLENWGKAHALYNGPERDRVNFPDLTRQSVSAPTRLGFIPESVFELFHGKTGVTGAYVFGIGAITFLISKEIVVLEHNASEVIAFSAMVYVFSKKFGKSIGDYFAKQVDDYEEKHWTQPFEQSKSAYKDSITAKELSIAQEAGQKYLYQAKKENVALQLESVYRARLNEVAQAVKNRLNYQMEVESSKRQFEQRHMVNWITENVVKGISPQQEKESLTKCISDLNRLAAKA